MINSWITSIKQCVWVMVRKVQAWIKANTTPASSSQVLGTVTDLFRSHAELVVENTLLRQQVIVLKRSVKQPKLTGRDRWLLMLLSNKLAHWEQAVIADWLIRARLNS